MIWGVATLYAVALALIGFWPTHVDRDIDLFDLAPVRWLVSDVGLLPAVAESTIEMLANVVLFVPLGVLAMLLAPRLSRRATTWGGFGLSVFIELGQAVARPERTASLTDVLTNTWGAYLGATLALVMTNQSHRTISARSSRPPVTNVQVSSLGPSESGDMGGRRPEA